MDGCLKKIAGLFLIPLGLWAALMVLGFGSMIDPSLSDSEWWMRFLRNIWQELLSSLAMVFVGVWLLFESPKRWLKR